jgi:hypothetical protein
MSTEDYKDEYGDTIDGNTSRHKDCIDISKITSNIYLGSYDGGAKIADGLKLFGITHILTVGHAMPPVHEDKFVYKVFPFEDHHKVNIAKYFPDCFTFIDQALSNKENKVLIHCFAGVSRSATITAAYLIQKYMMSYPEAIEYVRKARHWINPNNGFRQRLKELVSEYSNFSEEKADKYESAGKKLKRMHEKKTISVRDRDYIMNVFEEIFGLLHPHVLDIQTEMEPFLMANTI